MNKRYTPRQTVELDADPAAWPYRVEVGGEPVKAWPDKVRADDGAVKARVSFTIPADAKRGAKVVLHDRHGSRRLGTVTL